MDSRRRLQSKPHCRRLSPFSGVSVSDHDHGDTYVPGVEVDTGVE